MADMNTIALLGTGLMGAGMGANLLKQGFTLRAWNRTKEKAQPLLEKGAVLANTPAEAVAQAGLVVTMLADGPAVESVMSGPDGALAHMDRDALWVQCSTVGVASTERLAAMAARHGIGFVDAPVLGTRQPAEQGKLTVLASGPDALLDRCERLFNAIGTKTVRLGEVGAASRTKLVLNSWILGLMGALAETFALARALNVDPARFLETIAGGPLDAVYAQTKGKAMLAHSYPVSFPLHLALKDATLARDAATAAGVELPALEGVIRHFERAVALGHGDEDMAALAEAVSRKKDSLS
jgi:3-hydroxyisobutyrate dehydrogenase